MLATLHAIFRDNWEWRAQTWRLAVTELQKQVRGTALGWAWLLLTPALNVGVFWFALAIGLRTASPKEGVPYIVWLAIGIVPWFFMSAMFGQGSNVYRRYPHLVNRMRFPLPVITSFFTMAHFIIFLMTMCLVFVLMAATHVPVRHYAIQAPFLALLMFLFWATWSLLTSPLSALSKDFHNLLQAMTRPLFWLSGTIFDASRIQIGWIRQIMALNPITFFVTGFRAALCEDFWVWDRPQLIYSFLGVFVVMVLLALQVQKRLSSEMPDVL